MKEPSRVAIRRVFVLAAVVLSVAALVFGLLLYNRTKALTLAQIRNNALDIARIAAELVDTEVFASLKTGDEGTAAYRTVLSALERVRDSSDVEYLYTIRYNDYGVPVFCVDSDPLEPGMIGEAYSGAPAALQALDGQPAADNSPYKDRWGTHISAYAPLFLDGKPVGAAVVDLNYETVRGEITRVTALIVTLYAMTVLIGIALLLYVWRQTEKYEFRLRKAQEQVEENERVSARFLNPVYTPVPQTERSAPVQADTARETERRETDSLRARFGQSDALDYDEAIRLLGSEELLRQTLTQFHDDIQNGADEIERLWKEGDIETYTIRVHGLKSASRVIGATALSEQARRLEELGNRVREA